MYVDSCFLSMVLVGACMVLVLYTCMVLVLYTYDVGIIQVLFYKKKPLSLSPPVGFALCEASSCEAGAGSAALRTCDASVRARSTRRRRICQVRSLARSLCSSSWCPVAGVEASAASLCGAGRRRPYLPRARRPFLPSAGEGSERSLHDRVLEDY